MKVNFNQYENDLFYQIMTADKIEFQRLVNRPDVLEYIFRAGILYYRVSGD